MSSRVAYARLGRPLRWLLAALCCLSPAWADDDDGPAAVPPTSPRVYGIPGQVRLTAAQQAAAGLVSQPLLAETRRIETTSFGKVLDIQPLLDLRARLRAAQADAEVALAALRLAERNRNRIQSLYQADILAGRELAQAEAQWQSDRAREEAARRHIEAIRREARHLWGEELSRLALDGQAPLLEGLANHRRALVQVTLPAGVTLPRQGSAVFVARDFDRGKAVRAELISAAPRTDELVQGETWFFHAPAEHLRAGMRLNAWAPGGEPRHGVSLPASAIVWHAGRAWVYRDDSEGAYTRLPVEAPQYAGQSLFIDSGLAPGARIVVTGAQTLLSEEYRNHIPAEDDD